MEVKDVLGLLALALVIGAIGTAIKNGSNTSLVLSSAANGFSKVLATATQQQVG